MNTILAVALGGGLGAVLRYASGLGAVRLFGLDYPVGTLFVNIVGSFLIGILTGLFANHWQPSAEIRGFLITGILGGFTTFSAFSMDFVTLWESGAQASAIGYALVSVICSIFAVFAGLGLMRLVTA